MTGWTLGIVVDWWPLTLVGAGLVLLAWTLGRQRGPRSIPKPGPSGRESYDALARDAEELAQRLAAELDVRAGRLERLLAQADDHLRRLDGGGGDGTSGEVKPRRTPEVAPDDGARDPLNRRVYALADEGLAPVAIAQRLDQPTGKVELILALRGR
ncbi:MAG: hypothetical protein IT437_02600 [Phycisphaerales bacterium]|nr:hypothetical protein [Phycisphaerales bacterium]